MSTLAQGPVEARSLSSVTAIASNPPAYPRNPTHEKLDQLILYIVRVPGSQDLFLSPLKPPTKSSVSAEAINASLYYLHVATPEDDELLEQLELERKQDAERRRRSSKRPRGFARMNTIRRKPVKVTENGQESAPAPEQEDTPPNPPSLPPRPVSMPQQFAENTPIYDLSGPNAPPTGPENVPVEIAGGSGAHSPIARRPLPPVPPNEEAWGDHSNHNEPTPSTWKHNDGSATPGRFSLDSNRPPLPPRPSQDRVPSPRRNHDHSPVRKRSPPDPASRPGFRITLIRRDPTSGMQWNVATISTANPTEPVDLEIATPGYNRFVGSNDAMSLASLAANLPPGLIHTAGSSIPPAAQAAPAEQPAEQTTGPRKFHRQLRVSKPSDDHSSGQSELKSGYYVFNSPWNGTCTFSSSVNGRSLKCKHLIPGPSGVPTHSDGEQTNPAVTVAEIRFNMPSQAANLHHHATRHTNHLSSHFPTFHPQSNRDLESMSPTSKRASLSQFLNPNNYTRPRAHSNSNQPTAHTPDPHRGNINPTQLFRQTSLRASQFAAQKAQSGHAHFHRRRSPSNSSGQDSDEDRLDFSWPGNWREVSAKLGKLIIEDEGIKMLDLLVAACMAVWWRGYHH
ncbi:hypothetical protein N7470_000826 [Penicillium chermesinum]|nr:hypothetical protein N7470_000826 [Penicillium chermesinum]